MSLKKETREEIKRYILRHIDQVDSKVIPKTVDAHGVSRTTVNNYLRTLLASGVITRSGNSRAIYALVNKVSVFSYDTGKKLQEDSIFQSDILPLLSPLKGNAQEIWKYSFTEMMNNAIEHASAGRIIVRVLQNALSTTMLIMDDGIGIFNKIREYYAKAEGEELSLDEVVSMLFAGKVTTDKQHHSGEGIFFTSRIMDDFIICSEKKIFSHDVVDDMFFDADLSAMEHGTIVSMSLENETNREAAEIMNNYADVDRGFFRTQIPIAHVFPAPGPVSRSEARRLLAMIVKFQVATLDFSGVESIGQGFTHELFIVFRRSCPDIDFECINMNEKVKNMILRVQNTT